MLTLAPASRSNPRDLVQVRERSYPVWSLLNLSVFSVEESFMFRSCPSRLSRLPTVALVLVCFASHARAQEATPHSSLPTRSEALLEPPTHLFVVDAFNTCRFSRHIQPAVDAASDGDVILVKPGEYSSFRIDGKSLCVIGESTPTGVRPSAHFVIENLRSDQSVVIRGFESLQSPSFTSNAGPIWIEDCVWRSPSTITSWNSTVGFFRCQHLAVYPPTTGASGLLAQFFSTVIAYHSTFEGQPGVDAYFDEVGCRNYECDWGYGSGGGGGVFIGRRSNAYLFACSMRGGRGGDGLRDYFCENCYYYVPEVIEGGCGGVGLSLQNFRDAVLLETDAQGGFGGAFSSDDCIYSDDMSIGRGNLTQLRGRTGEFRVDSPVEAGRPLQYRFKGTPGWKVFLTYAFDYQPTYDPRFHGVSVVPLESRTAYIGTLPASGELVVSRSYGDLLQPGSSARVIYLQAKFHESSTCYSVLGTPSAVVVVGDPCH